MAAISGLRTGAQDTSSRKSSSSSEGSRRSSLKSSLQRKFGSVSDNSFVASLDEELKRKLDSIGEDDKRTVRVTAESQAERAARVCDIIVEEKEK